MPVTVQIASAIRTALIAVVPDGTAVYARGVKTDKDGVASDVVADAENRCPMVDIIPTERVPHHHASALRAYPVRIRVVTWEPDDPFQESLYDIGEDVGEWLAGAPSLTITPTEFDALVANTAPDVDNAGQSGQLQYMEWNIIVNTRKAT